MRIEVANLKAEQILEVLKGEVEFYEEYKDIHAEELKQWKAATDCFEKIIEELDWMVLMWSEREQSALIPNDISLYEFLGIETK